MAGLLDADLVVESWGGQTLTFLSDWGLYLELREFGTFYIVLELF